MRVIVLYSVRTVIIYIFGVFQLMIWMGISACKALIVGVLPFIPGDLMKMLIAIHITMRIKFVVTRHL